MTKHDTTLGKTAETTTDFETRVEAAFLEFMGKNGGKMPTNSQLNEIVGTSMSRLCPLTRRLKEKHMARETKLSAMSDVPDEIRVAHERLLTDLWIMTRDLQNAELVEMKKTLQLQGRDHRAEIDDFETIVLDLETRLDSKQEHNAVAAQPIPIDARFETSSSSTGSSRWTACTLRISKVNNCSWRSTRQIQSSKRSAYCPMHCVTRCKNTLRPIRTRNCKSRPDAAPSVACSEAAALTSRAQPEAAIAVTRAEGEDPMNIANNSIMDSQSEDVQRFLAEHGTGLNSLYHTIYGNPFADLAKSIVNIAKRPLHQRTISLDDTLAEAVDVLLDMLGEPSNASPSSSVSGSDAESPTPSRLVTGT